MLLQTWVDILLKHKIYLKEKVMYKKTILLTLIFSNLANANICTENDYIRLAQSLKNNDFITEAIKMYEKALKINPNNSTAHWDLGMELFKQCNYPDSLKHFHALAEIEPDNPYTYFNIAYNFFKLGQLDKAEDFFNLFSILAPNSKNPYRFLGFMNVLKGNFEKGYNFYNMFYGQLDKEQEKLWHGQNAAGKTVYIWDNVGMGDVFCFIQYARKLKEQGATVILGVRKGLIPLMSSCPYVDNVFLRFSQIPPCDFVIDINRLTRMSYRAGFGVPCGYIEPYLFANQQLVEKYKQTMSQDTNFKIGICWAARSYKNKATGKTSVNKRSIPLYHFYFLSKLEKVSLYSLQRVNDTEQLDYMPKDFNIQIFDENFDKNHGSFSDTAAVMKNLDLIITADTSIANLAGALGVTVWVLLPFAADWRWQHNTSHTGWYPTMRLFRQNKPGDWEYPINQVCDKLCNILFNR